MTSAVSLSQPGTYVHWSIFLISEANLVLIAVMVVIFGAALLIPFPKGRKGAALPPASPAAYCEGGAGDGAGVAAPAEPGETLDPEDARMWTARVRRRALNLLPPGKLLPDRQ